MLEIRNSLVRISLLLELIVEKLFLLNAKVSSTNLYSIVRKKKRFDLLLRFSKAIVFFFIHVETREFSKQMITRRSVRVHKKITYTCELSTELVGKSISINASRVFVSAMIAERGGEGATPSIKINYSVHGFSCVSMGETGF